MSKTEVLPGLEKDIPTIPELTEAAEAYVKVRDQRILLNKEEVVAKRKIADLMHHHKLESYQDDEVKITIDRGKEKIKVKIGSASQEEDGSE